MLFNSYTFLLFFPIVVILYFILPVKLRRIWLLLASYYFYMSWNAKYILLILFVTIVTYLSGIFIDKLGKERSKPVVFISFLSSLSVLFVFKYLDFSIDCLNTLFSKLGITLISNPFSLILPVGISFYTFQALSYTVDIYRGVIPVEKNFINYALFVSFFPQLVAGPIERSGNLLNQIKSIPDRKKLWDSSRIHGGLVLMIWGMFLKVVIADRIANIVDTVFDKYYMFGTIGLCIGAITFAIQIYCDFSSYSIIAIGAARVLGFTLMENFNTPHFSMSIKEFWRRWHISLSTWFKDYLYIPLGGSRCSKPRKYFNIFITFLVSGLWHGANVTYIVWGGLHGIYQIVGDLTENIREKICDILNINRKCFSFKLWRCLSTFVLLDFALIIFRADSMKAAIAYIYRLFTVHDFYALFDVNAYDFGITNYEINILLISLLVMLVVSILKYVTGKNIDELLAEQNDAFRLIVETALIMMIVIFGVYGPQMSAADFIYFQF